MALSPLYVQNQGKVLARRLDNGSFENLSGKSQSELAGLVDLNAPVQQLRAHALGDPFKSINIGGGNFNRTQTGFSSPVGNLNEGKIFISKMGNAVSSVPMAFINGQLRPVKGFEGDTRNVLRDSNVVNRVNQFQAMNPDLVTFVHPDTFGDLSSFGGATGQQTFSNAPISLAEIRNRSFLPPQDFVPELIEGNGGTLTGADFLSGKNVFRSEDKPDVNLVPHGAFNGATNVSFQQGAQSMSAVAPAVSVAPPKLPNTDIRLTPTEFDLIRNARGVGEDNFDAVFSRDGSGNISLKGNSRKLFGVDQSDTRANGDAINAAFRFHLGRDANSGELSKFNQMKVGDLENILFTQRQRIIGGGVQQQVTPKPSAVPVQDIDKTESIPDISSIIKDNVPQAIRENLNNVSTRILDRNQQAIFDLRGEQEKLATRRRELEQERQFAFQNEFQNVLLNQNREQELRNALEEFEVQTKMAILTDIQKRMAQEQEGLGLAIISEGERTAPIGLIGRRQQALQEQAAVRIGSLAAQAEAIGGNLNLSLQLADSVVGAINAQREQQLEGLGLLMEMSESKIIRLESEERAMINEQVNLIQTQIGELEQGKNVISQLFVEHPTAAAQAGITFDMTREQALESMAPFLAEQEERQFRIAEQLSKLDIGERAGQQGLNFDFETGQISEPGRFSEGQSVTTPLGSNGIITALGSPLWSHGLDVQLEGMEQSDIVIPFDFEVTQVLNESESGGFGKQVRVKNLSDGREIWFGHLSSINLAPGTYKAGTSIGKQGNTGKTMGETGVHVDITIPTTSNPDKNNEEHWLKPDQIASYFGLNPQGGSSEIVGGSEATKIANAIFEGTSSLTVAQLPTDQRIEVETELGKLKKQALERGDVVGVIRASAGGKGLEQGFVESFEKGLNVVGQLDELATEVEGQLTGPVVDIFRSNNPFDVKAQLIEAKLIAIVPNLARGIYNEVGVLTDADVQLYKSTLPNLSNPEEVRQALLGATVRTVQRSLENKIKVNAGSGRDVSGLENVYVDVKNVADALLAKVEGMNGGDIGSTGGVQPSQADIDYVNSLNIK